MRKLALVTGGAIRVGRAIALGLAEEGFDLIVHYHGSGEEAQEVAERIREMGREVHLHRADLSRGEEVRGLAGRVREIGRLDLLVNSASIFRELPLAEVDEAEWDEVMAINLKAPFLLVQGLASLLAESTEAHVIHIVDLSAFQPWLDHPHHSVSKAGLLHLTKVQARALAPRIRVNAIAPGAVLLPEHYDEERHELSLQRAPLRKLGSPEDVVRTVLFLDRSPFITGEVIVVDGGRLLGSP